MVDDCGTIAADNLMRFRHGAVTYDQRDGLAAVPDVENIEYLGFVVLMRPSTFLDLTPELARPAPHVREQLVSGKPISMGYMEVCFDEEELIVREHEGRSRASTILSLYGDEPIPVAVFPKFDRARHVTDERLRRLADGVRRQRSSLEPHPPFIRGPLFEIAFLAGRERRLTAPMTASSVKTKETNMSDATDGVPELLLQAIKEIDDLRKFSEENGNGTDVDAAWETMSDVRTRLASALAILGIEAPQGPDGSESYFRP